MFHVDRSFERSGRRTFARSIELNAFCVRMQSRWRLSARSHADMRVVSSCNRPRNVLRMTPQMHADASGFRARAEGEQARQKHEAGRQRKTTAHDRLLHNFVLVPVGVAISKTGSTGPPVSRPAILRDRTGANGVIIAGKALPSGRKPNQILTFRPCPRKLPEAPKSTDRTEQAP
jgi:hypothetical protein